MRIEYEGTVLDSILKRHEIMPIDFVYLDRQEFDDRVIEAEEKDILNKHNSGWFTVKDCSIVFYLEH